jgi:DNA mismatch repair protein mutS
LTDLEDKYTRIKNYSVAVQEDGDNIVFLRKIIEGAADKSYGIYVAKLAKLPDDVIARADQILVELEKNHIDNSASIDQSQSNSVQLSFDMFQNQAKNKEIQDKNRAYMDFIARILDIDIMNSTPMDIMNAMYELKKEAEKISKS